eukprot:jgi/Phyca11/121336/e_gw1.44.324.1
MACTAAILGTSLGGRHGHEAAESIAAVHCGGCWLILLATIATKDRGKSLGHQEFTFACQSEWATVERYLANCATRKAPTIPKKRKQTLYVYGPDEAAEMEDMWNRVWRILSSICIMSLWTQRNRVIFESEVISSEQAVQEFWRSSTRQLRAIAERERRSPKTRINGTRLQLGLELLQAQPRETPSKVDTRSLRQDKPVLVTRLQTYQMSCKF